MSSELPVITPTSAIPLSFENVKNAYDHGDNDEIIRQATSIIEHIEQLELLSLLEHRAHALSMKSKFETAAQDTETMIEYAPTLPQGYLCFGKLLTMQGKHARASIVYQEGLEKVSTNDPAYGQLLQAKKMADEKKDHCFDLVSALPLELKDAIVILLSEKERANLFDVSTTWSRWLENCPEAWKYIYNEDVAVSHVLPKVAKYIKHLVFTEMTEEIWLKYLEHLENGDFRNLESLQVPEIEDYDVFSTNSLMSLMNGFWKTRFTLTKIDLTFPVYESPITITDILFYLPYLETLILSTDKIHLANMLGDLERLQEPHRSLVDLTLDTSYTTAAALKPLAKFCPYVRRLRLEYATYRVLDFVSDYFPNVEMLAYNFGYTLPESHKVLNQDYNNNEPIIPTTSVNNMYIKQKEGRLRAFYSSCGWKGVSGAGLFRLLQKNQKTLEIVYADMGRGNEREIEEDPRYYNPPEYLIEAASTVLNVDRLETIMFRSDEDGLHEPLCYRMVRSSLKYFKLVETYDLPAVVDMLISSQPSLETLGFKDVYIKDNDQETTIATQCMVQLLNRYAVTSLQGSNTTTNLRNVMLENCKFISDDILDALANIRTIRGLSFGDYSNITLQGFKNFFIKLKKQNVRITKLKFERMKDVVDTKTLLDIINTMEGLERLHLTCICELTERDIIKVIDNAKKLNTLIVENCWLYFKEIMPYVNKHNRKFKYLKLIDYHESDIDIFNIDTFA
ncbi:hypothetical protein INT45_013505 [Circinella minor]|uniref:F-box domain-containing protein n=1 Tax=Circinella minor TaxID=1195481 RepID=A0A8H7S6X9_9FUNG|nr:hypothetical protein INT45_013505 [Circinella minor]